ncbi:MAG TPA: FAD/NAD(P)-binding oxidoreductase [Acidimicrobiia bacterium]|jgi:sulfide:quinone oxidoreductase
MRVVVLGAGFGGLELTTKLSEEFGETADIVLIDREDGFIFGFSKLDVMFGRATADAVLHRYADITKPGVKVVQAEITAIDPVAKYVDTTEGPFDADILVIALGADVHPEATPGLLDGGHEFYTPGSALGLLEVLENFQGGRVVIGVTSLPFKCPPAPSEAALLLHDFLTERGRRDRSEIALVTPQPAPIPPSPDTSAALLAAFAERGISFNPNRALKSVDPARKLALFDDGSEMPYDLLFGIPVHSLPAVVAESGLAVDGWVPVHPMTLATSFPGVFAIGDVTSIGTPKAGVFAERQGEAAAERIAASLRSQAETTEYDGKGLCYIQMGSDQVARVNVQFTPGAAQPVVGIFDEPTMQLAADKAEFGRSRARRWFGKEWAT